MCFQVQRKNWRGKWIVAAILPRYYLACIAAHIASIDGALVVRIVMVPK